MFKLKTNDRDFSTTDTFAGWIIRDVDGDLVLLVAVTHGTSYFGVLLENMTTTTYYDFDHDEIVDNLMDGIWEFVGEQKDYLLELSLK